MAAAAIESAMDNLTQLLLYHADLIRDARSQVEGLEDDLRLLRAFLDDMRRQSNNNTASSSSSFSSASLPWLKEIRSIVYKMEDTLDSYITERGAHGKSKASIVISKVLGAPPKLVIDDIRKKIESILDRGKIELAKNTFATAAATEIATGIEGMKLREDNIVGCEDEVETIIKCLMEDTEELDAISIVGPPGIGKATLARKIFGNERIIFEFPTRVWVHVSQVFHKKDVLLAILRAFTSNTDNMESMTDQELVQTLREILKCGKFLIVLDDVWTAEDWMDLRDAFPKLNNAGKLLITSRNVEVARCANPNRVPHEARLLTREESWQLLLLEVFGSSKCPPELEEYGKLIAEKCNGLPLAIVEIGRILSGESLSEDITITKNAWQKVSESVPTYLKEDANMKNMVSLSYYKLPYYLRPCFLYLGMFPKNFEIPVWALIRLWIAEGFIQERAGSTLEQIAESYLQQLINCSLVMVGKVKVDGQIKTCRIHDMLHDFCIKESGTEEENSFQEFTRSAEAAGGFTPSITTLETCRRVCIHSKAVLDDFLSLKPIGPRVRSFVCFSKEKPFSLSYENASSVFKLLRIFDAKPVVFTRFPKELAHLVHLRYIVMSSNFNVIPETIGELWNLQTLVFYTSSRILEIKANIWKMMRLRHLLTDAPAILPKPAGKGREAGEMLQTLGTILPESCTEDVLGLAPNLDTLYIHGSLVKLLDAKGLDKLGRLEKMKLVNKNPYDGSDQSSGEKLLRLPHAHKFPPRLRWLTLRATQLDWEHMSTLAMLDRLEVLKLKEKAFVGDHWEMSDDGYFYGLEVLHIEDLDFITWVAEKNYFPKLKRLRVRNCGKLEKVPDNLGDAKYFKRLDLEGVRQSVLDFATKIQKEKKQYASPSSSRNSFEINIGPAGDE